MFQSKILNRGSLPLAELCLFRPKSFHIKGNSYERPKDVPLKLLLHMVQSMSPFPRKCSLFISFSSMLSSISQPKEQVHIHPLDQVRASPPLLRRRSPQSHHHQLLLHQGVGKLVSQVGPGVEEGAHLLDAPHQTSHLGRKQCT